MCTAKATALKDIDDFLRAKFGLAYKYCTVHSIHLDTRENYMLNRNIGITDNQ